MPDNLIAAVVILFTYSIVLLLRSGSLPFLIKKLYLLTAAGKKQQLLRIQPFLELHSGYFKALSENGKKIFINRCLQFVGSKNFIGMEGMKVTFEMEIKLAAAAIQITFGFKNFSFSHYHTVKIFPEPFYSRLHDRYLKGGASTSGVLFFSWKDFLEGYSSLDDCYNLGLHEMAHALRLQLLHGSDFDSRFANYADRWEEIARPEFEAMNQRESSFLREYAAVNMEEFFAVCVEHFFEVPEEFKSHLPDIYNHLCFLLNQDPLRDEADFTLSSKFIEDINIDRKLKPIPLEVEKNYDYDTWHWSFNFIIAGLFGAFSYIITIYGTVLFRPFHIFLIIIGSCSVIAGFYKYFYKKGIYLFRHLMMFASVGVGLIISALILFANKNLVVSQTYRTYKIASYVYFYGHTKSENAYILILDNDALKRYPEIRTFEEKQFGEFISKADSVKIGFSQGIFGFENFENKELLFTEKSANP